MSLSMHAVDAMFANARRILEPPKSELKCTSCGRPLDAVSSPQTCEGCGACNVLFRSSFAACEAVSALRAMKRIIVMRTAFVRSLGWVVGFARERKSSAA